MCGWGGRMCVYSRNWAQKVYKYIHTVCVIIAQELQVCAYGVCVCVHVHVCVFSAHVVHQVDTIGVCPGGKKLAHLPVVTLSTAAILCNKTNYNIFFYKVTQHYTPLLCNPIAHVRK